MYSNNQWSFNPAAYQNIPYEQVDWASLAQQWIKMKETMPTNQGPPPPPAPQISKTAEPAPTASTPTAPVPDIEGGEAPMDMDTKDDEAPSVGVASSGNWNQWGNWQSQWGWGWSGNAGTVPLAENQTASVENKVKSQSNDSIPALNDVRNFPLISNTGTCTPQVPSSFNYNNTGGGIIPPILPKSNFAYENSFNSTKTADNWKGGKASNRQTQKSVPAEQFPVIDAAKKKQLPAWIREGLNKMEREKQKKLERERMAQERIIMEQLKAEVKEEPAPSPAPAYVQVPPHQEPPSAPEHRKSPELKYQKRSPPVEPHRQRSRMDAAALRKTKDQIMEESMLKVRRILTEILLEATEKQVHIIAKEEHRRFKTASAPQIRKSNALTSLTGNLGLDVYDSEDNSSDGDRDRDDDVDSDEELQMIIEKKKRDFTLVEDEIERLIEDQEAKERLIALQDAKDEDDNDDDGNEDDEEDEPRIRSNRDKDGSGSHEEGYHRSRRTSTSTSEIKQLNGDSKPIEETEKSRTRKKSKSTSRSSSSSSSASTSSSSSGRSSSENSTKSDRTGSSNESKKKRKRKSRKKTDKKSKSDSKTKRRDSSESDSEKRSSSRSRYYDKYKRSRNSDSIERKRHRQSPSYRRRSPSYHRSSRREQSSKYKDSPSHSRRRDYTPDSKRSRYRSSSRESSKHSRYKRR